MGTDLSRGTRKEDPTVGRRVRQILGVLEIAFAVYMVGFAIYLMIRGDYETVTTMGGGILLFFLGGVFLLRSDPRSGPPRL